MKTREKDDQQCLKKGTLVRIELTNFMIYRKVAFVPGPFLNLVLGPNGSGKSALVCSIILGFGGDPAVTGRSKELSDYVRFGSTTGSICIELSSGSPDEDNFVIERHLKVNSKGTKKAVQDTWRLNGRDVKKADVLAFNKALNIDINNLCQILPQERVVEFARMSPKQLLCSTEKSFGDDNMYEQHQRLIALTGEVHEHESEMKDCRTFIATYTKYKTDMEPDLRLINKRKNFLEEIEWLKKKLVWLKFEQKRADFVDVKRQFDRKKKELETFRESSKPYKSQMRECDTLSSNLKSDKLKQNNLLKPVSAEIHRINTDGEQIVQDVDEIMRTLQGKLDEQKKLNAEIDRLTEKMESYKCDLLSDEDREECNHAMLKLKSAIDQLEKEWQIINDKVETEKASLVTLAGEMGMVKRRLNYLESKGNVQLENLGKVNANAKKANDWLQENRGKFEGNVYPPIITQIEIGDENHAGFIEQGITSRELATFLFERREDLQRFTSLLLRECNIRVNVAMVPVEDASHFQRQFDLNQYKSYGIIGVVSDLFTAPPQVMAYLCKNHKLHLIPVGSAQTDEKIEELIQNSPFRKVYTPRNTYAVVISRYDNEKSTRVRRTAKARFLNATVDSAEIEREKAKLLQLAQEHKTKNDEVTMQTRKADAIQEKINEKNYEYKQIKDRIEYSKRVGFGVQEQRRKIEKAKKDLVDPEVIKQEAIDKIKAKRAKQFDVLDQIDAAVGKCLPPLKQQIVMNSKASFIMHLQVIYNDKVKTFTAREKELETTFREIQKQLVSAREIAKDFKNKAIDLSGFDLNNNEDPEIQHKFAELPSTTEEIENECDTLKLKCDGIRVDESVLGEYQKYKEQIEAKEQICAESEKKVMQKNAEMQKIEGRWLEALKTLVERVNVNYAKFMETLGYSGKVYLHTADKNFEDYGIKIGVKFRQSEPMKDLDAYHQSGGERSVSTMVYMLALQELAKVPFRLVDEINQGMDEKNERGVFSLIGQVSRQNSSQYFLFSPKLLNNLDYSKEMKVHIIFNAPKVHVNWAKVMDTLNDD